MRSRLLAAPLFGLAAICLASTGALAQSSSNSAATTGGSGVQVGTLGDATPDYAGTLEEGGGSFPVDMWKGTDRALVEQLLPKLPPALGSPAMRDLERRLLLTNAESPEGKSTGVGLFAARADRLAAMGFSRDAASLLAMMPARLVDKTAARLRLDSLLLAGDLDGACKAVDDTRQAASADTYWQQAQVFCQIRAGKADQAALGLDLLGEQGGKDTAFFKLASALGGEKVKLDSLPDPTPLDLAMLRAAKLPLPHDAAQSHSPGVLAALAQDRSLDAPIRLAAAEEAAVTGGLTVDQLQEAYTSVTFPSGGLDDPVAAAMKDPGPMGRALLYQATGATADPQTRAKLLQAALAGAQRRGGYLLAEQVNMTYLLPIAPSADLAWFAGDAGRALYVAGHYEQANAWLEQIQGGTGDTAGVAAALETYAQIAGVGAAASRDPAWRFPAVTGKQGAERLMAVFEGLGQPLGAGAMIAAQAPAEAIPVPAADPALLFSLSEAAAAHRIGETVLLSLYALGPEGPAGCNPLALSRVIAGLRQIGYDSEARAIAIEAAVAAGV